MRVKEFPQNFLHRNHSARKIKCDFYFFSFLIMGVLKRKVHAYSGATVVYDSAQTLTDGDIKMHLTPLQPVEQALRVVKVTFD